MGASSIITFSVSLTLLSLAFELSVSTVPGGHPSHNHEHHDHKHQTRLTQTHTQLFQGHRLVLKVVGSRERLKDISPLGR